MAKESLFLIYIRLTLKKWTGFQAAIEEGMGGRFNKEKELWLGSEIENYFKNYDNVTPDDLENYIGQMMEDEFQTYFEDGSLLEVSQCFCRAYELSLVDPKASIFEEALKIAELSACSKQSVQNEKVITERSISADMEKLTVDGSDEEEWTVVTRKSHRK